jgi:hypothetical protein
MFAGAMIMTGQGRVMSEPGELSDEHLQRLPPGLPRRYAEYKQLQEGPPAPPPTNVGGYDALLAYFRSRGEELSRSKEGLAAVDQLIDAPEDRDSLAELVRPIGMFYGDLLTHTIPGAHWEVTVEDLPCVRVTRKTAVSVVYVAERRLTVGRPTLLQNYAHVLELVTRES